jgi:hypothetical protein
VRLLADFLERTGMPTSIDAIRREHVESGCFARVALYVEEARQCA